MRTPNTYWDWVLSKVYIVDAMQGLVAQQITNFEKFPPRQKAASFNLDAVLRQLEEATAAPATRPARREARGEIAREEIKEAGAFGDLSA